MVRSCLVMFCKSRGRVPGLIYFHLTPKRYLPWLKAVGRNPQIEKLSHGNVICSEHFTDADFTYEKNMKRLKRDAIPTLKLGPRKPSSSIIKPVPCIDVENSSTSSKTSTCGQMISQVYIKEERSEEHVGDILQKSIDLEIPSNSSDTLAYGQMTSQVHIKAEDEHVEDILHISGSSSSTQSISPNKEDALKTNILQNTSILNRKAAVFNSSSDNEEPLIKIRRDINMIHNYSVSPQTLSKRLDEEKRKKKYYQNQLRIANERVKRLTAKVSDLKGIVKQLKAKKVVKIRLPCSDEKICES